MQDKDLQIEEMERQTRESRKLEDDQSAKEAGSIEMQMRKHMAVRKILFIKSYSKVTRNIGGGNN